MRLTPPNDHSVPRSCEKVTRAYRDDLINFDEWVYNLTVRAISEFDGTIEECVAFVPADLVCPYREWLCGFLEPVDFMPDPRPFLVGPTPEQIEGKKRELRPKYVKLYEMISERAKDAGTEGERERGYQS